MTAPAARRESQPTVFSPLTETTTHEASHEPSPEARESLARERTELQREVLLWQSWPRFIAVTLLCVAAILLDGTATRPSYATLAAIAGAYVAVVFVIGMALRRASDVLSSQWLTILLLTVDLGAMGGIIHVSTPPQLASVFLLLALLSTQLASFYFGWGMGTYAAIASAAIYGGIAYALPPVIPGASPASLLSVAVFAVAAAVSVYTLGSFRARLNQLRLYCKVIEEGDLSPSLDLTAAKYPDDVTLLARSFDAMRSGLAEQIGTDPLTGCLNRRALEARLKSDWRLAKRRSTHVALAAIDLDHFKQINDTRGHPVGDVVLQQLAGIMKSPARDTDAVSRFGGDEFVILLPDTGWQGALTFAERLRRRVDDFTFGPPGSPMTITISVGVALARGTDPISPEELLKEADRSLYKAKQQGRNRVFA